MEKPWNPKMYIVTRKDLAPGIQACQAIHAMTEFAHDYPEVEKEWHKTSNHIALLAAANMQELEDYALLASERNIKYSCFFEPDLKNELTAVAFEPILETRDLLSNLNLALKNIKEKNTKRNRKLCPLL